MLAARFHEQNGLSSLRLEEVDRPTPGLNEVLVDVHAASVNTIDLRVLNGEFPHDDLPVVLGGDFAGEVVDVGVAVDDLAAGDRVYGTAMSLETWGTFAEYSLIPADRLGRFPDATSFERAAAGVTGGSTAFDSLFEIGGLSIGETCLIHGGSGGVGHIAVQLAAASGARTLATAGSTDARETVRSLGADAVFDYRSADLPNEIADAAPDGVDVVLDHRLDEYLGLNLEVAAAGGRVVAIQGDLPATSAVPLRNKGIAIHGRSGEQWTDRRDFLESTLARLLAERVFEPRVQAEYPLSKVGESLQVMRDERVIGKLVITM